MAAGLYQRRHLRAPSHRNQPIVELLPLIRPQCHCMVQALRLKECTFKHLPGWLPQLASLQKLQLEWCDVPWQQSIWTSSAPALRTLHCICSRMNKVRINLLKWELH